MKKNLLLILFFILLIQCNKSNKNDLEAMNNIAMPEYEELVKHSDSKDSIKVLILGNSITSHGIAMDIGWHHKSGMASSELSKDYVHLFFDRMKVTYPNKNLIVRYSNWSQLERYPNGFKGFKIAQRFAPDILIYQLSDNVNTDSLNTFKQRSVDFLQKFPSKKVVISPFFMNNSNYRTSKLIASESNSIFLDISEISKNKTNRAYSDLRADKQEWKSNGIGEHPGNTGMLNISEAIFKALKH